jgi:alanyl-tRNA synthetase
MTARLYYTDPNLREFDAIVSAVDLRDGRTLVTLDRTAFYPTSGGQPFDTGTLGSLTVVDVIDEEDGLITHVVDAAAGGSPPPIAAGDRVHASIDWPRRFDHMQQHSGQHVLSAAFDRLAGIRTVSFHLGAASSTIDLARAVSPGEIGLAEDEANRVVWENRPVTIRFVTAEEAARLPLRKEPVRGGTLRLIDVEDFDLSACGGTHVARTGGIGIVAITSWERFKGGQRIEFLCGGRALRGFRSLRDTAASAGHLLSVAADDIPSTIERLQTEAKSQKRAVAALQGELVRYRADELAAAAEQTSHGLLVARTLDADASALQALAAAIAVRPGHIVVLVSASRPALAVISRSQDLDRQLQANRVLAALIAQFGGRGGGRPDLAQAGGLDAASSEILAAARTLLTELRIKN